MSSSIKQIILLLFLTIANTSPVYLDQTNFTLFIEQNPRIIINFDLGPDCQTCKVLSSKVVRVQQDLNEYNILVAHFNASKEKEFIQQQYNIEIFPSLYFVNDQKFKQLDIQGTYDSIIEQVLTSINQKPIEIYLEQEVNNFMKKKTWGFVYIAENSKDINIRKFQDVALYYDFNNFAYIYSQELYESFGGNLVGFKNKGRDKKIFKGDLSRVRIKNFIENFAFGRFEKYSTLDIAKIFEFNKNGAVLFVQNNDKSGIDSFQQASKTYPFEEQLYFAIIDIQKDKAAQKYLQQLKIDDIQENQCFIYQQNGKTKFKSKGLQLEKLIEFTVSFLNNALKPYLSSKQIKKSEQNKYTKITLINGEHFDQKVFSGKQDSIVLFYNTNESDLINIFQDLASKLQGNKNLQFFAIDMDNNEINEKKKLIPRLTLYKNAKKENGIDYIIKKGRLSIQQAILFIQENTSHQWVNADL